MQLHERHDEIATRGAAMHLVGNGAPHFIEGFREHTGYAGSIYTDPSLKTFEQAGLLRSMAATLGPRSISSGMKSMVAGHRQGKVEGDRWQQGGALVVNRAAEILYSHRSSAAGDNVTVDQLLSAL